MKIVDRKTFLAMPEGTVYCKIQFRDPTPKEQAYSKDGWDSSFDIESPSIKGETCSSSNDFFTCGIGELQAKEGDPIDVLQDICEHPGKEVPFEMVSGRDGLYDDTHVYFAIYSRNEVQEMIDELQKALTQAYEVKQGEQKETLCDKCKKAQPSHSCQDITALGRCALEKQEEQKSSWSDEDNAVLDALIRRLQGENVYISPHLAAECLKSLKGRVQPQPQQEWSVEDRSKVQRICKYLNEVKKYCADITEVRECIDWLKALIPQNT
jgi:hypothetical protein